MWRKSDLNPGDRGVLRRAVLFLFGVSLAVGPGQFQLALAAGNPLPTRQPTSAPPTASVSQGKAALPTLTTASAVRNLQPQQAERQHPVRLRGVVTYWHPEWLLCFVQDGTSGIFVAFERRPNLQRGDRVEVNGVTGPGQYAPQVERAQVTVLGPGELPTPRRSSFAQLSSGTEDSQWVEVEGTIRSVLTNETHVTMKLAMSGGPVELQVLKAPGGSVPAHLVGAQVRARGACGTIFNSNRQLTGVRLMVQRLGDVQVEKEGPRDLFALPLQPIGTVLQFAPQRPSSSPVRVQGVVTCQISGEKLFIHDGTNALSVSTLQTNRLEVGSRVDVAGFPQAGGPSVSLEDAAYRLIGPGRLPNPVPVTAEQILAGEVEGQLVVIEGNLLAQVSGAAEQMLVLQQDAATVHACVLEAQQSAPFPPLPKGSRIRLTGVCATGTDRYHRPRASRIILRSAADVVVLEEPSWWTQQRIHSLFVVCGAIGLLFCAWLAILKRQVQRQTTLARQRLEQELAAEKRFHDLVEQATDMIYSLDLEGNFTSINEAGAKLLGYSPGDLVGRSLSSIVPPERLAAALAQRAATVGGDTRAVYELEFVRSDGGVIVAEISSWPLFLNGQTVGWEGIGRDVTARKRIEHDLRQLTRAVEQSPASVLITDLEGNIEYVNPKFLQVTGYSLAEVLGQNPRFLKSGLTPPQTYKDLWSTISAGREWHGLLRNKKKNGEIFWESAVISPIKNEQGIITHFLAVKEDITERRRTEERIGELVRLIELANDAILVRDIDGQVQFVNSSAARLFGWDSTECRGRNVRQLAFCTPAAFEEANRQLLEHGRWSGELDILGPEGKRLIHSSWTLVPDGEGKPKTVLTISTDMTETKKLENQFLRAQRMESIGTIAAGIAHDLNNILTPIMLATEALQLQFKQDGARNLLAAIDVSVRRGAEIIKQVLTFSRGVDGERLPIPPRRLIQEVVKISEETFPKDIIIKQDAPRDLWMVVGDQTQLHQLVLNLAVNARDAMPNGGELTFTVQNVLLEEGNPILPATAQPGPYIALEVKDTGMGIPETIVDRIFDPFFTTKPLGKGTGLGLSSAVGIVKSHGGFMNVSSQVGVGSVFRVYLPAAPGENAVPGVAERGTLPCGSGELILVVDDETALRMVTEKMLSQHGYRTLLAGTGAEALAVFSEHQGEIKLVITDIMMPGMSGQVLTRELKKREPSLKVIASSGLIASSQLDTPGEAGFIDLLRKPYTVEELLSKVARALSSETNEVASLAAGVGSLQQI